jgi:ribosome-associated heat shock protein Hsp15
MAVRAGRTGSTVQSATADKIVRIVRAVRTANAKVAGPSSSHRGRSRARRRPIQIRRLPSLQHSRPNSKPTPRNGAELDRQRIDKWLWHARVVRTRSAAAALASAGHVRLNGQRVDAPARTVRAGDVLTIALDRSIRVLKVTSFVERRGPGGSGASLYEDLAQDLAQDLAADPPPRREPAPAERDFGAGRPTKRERRALDRFISGEDED